MNWLDNWSPWRLRKRLAKSEEHRLSIELLEAAATDGWGAAREQQKRAEFDAAELRALVLQLRVSESTHQGRAGFAVTAFIPNSAVEKLRPDPALQKAFIERVATMLLRRAMLGLFHVRQGADKPAAIMWAPLSPHSTKREVLAFTETKCLNDSKPSGTLTKL